MKCFKCNQSLYDGAKTCAFCGEIIDPELKAKTEAKQERKEDFKTVIYATGMTMVLLAVLFFAGNIFENYSPLGKYGSATATFVAEKNNEIREEKTRVAGVYLMVTANARSTSEAVDQYCGSKNVDQSLKAVMDLVERWKDAVELAMSTDREALAPQVERLQEIRREARDVNVPGCLEDGKTILISSMDAQIEGCLAFMRMEQDDVVNGLLDQAANDLELFAAEVERVRACMPVCK